MKVTITSRNFNASEHLKDKVEATINAKGTIFRAEETASAAYDAIDRVIEKLSTQMSRYKTKLQRKHKEHKEFMFTELPDIEQADDIKVVKTKKLELVPMSVEEAVIQMELMEHNFFIFLDADADAVSVVYKRKNADYGVIETTY